MTLIEHLVLKIYLFLDQKFSNLTHNIFDFPVMIITVQDNLQNVELIHKLYQNQRYTMQGRDIFRVELV